MTDIEELEYLRYFYNRCDFGPAHEDVMLMINEDFEAEFEKAVPPGYRLNE